MYDRSLVYDLLVEMADATDKIMERCGRVCGVDDLMTQEGQILLDSICMQLIALGEGVKKVDKLTDKKLLAAYPEVNWRAVAAMRDVLSHHYFDLNAETVYGVCTDEIEKLQTTLKAIVDAFQAEGKQK